MWLKILHIYSPMIPREKRMRPEKKEISVTVEVHPLTIYSVPDL